jgi:hypothetical protein
MGQTYHYFDFVKGEVPRSYFTFMGYAVCIFVRCGL